ncbi:hypothetical protein QR77_17055, partial [Streptomyces sp. 150FB]
MVRRTSGTAGAAPGPGTLAADRTTGTADAPGATADRCTGSVPAAARSPVRGAAVSVATNGCAEPTSGTSGALGAGARRTGASPADADRCTGSAPPPEDGTGADTGTTGEGLLCTGADTVGSANAEGSPGLAGSGLAGVPETCRCTGRLSAGALAPGTAGGDSGTDGVLGECVTAGGVEPGVPSDPLAGAEVDDASASAGLGVVVAVVSCVIALCTAACNAAAARAAGSGR